MEEKKNLLTYAGLKKLEEELHDLKVVKLSLIHISEPTRH